MQDSSYYSFERKEIFPFIPQSIQKTLDVGCGVGAFSTKLKRERNAETWGIEMVEGAAKQAENNLDNVLVGTFDEVESQLPSNYFDCVFFNDVLEHMAYPEECLRKVRTNLNLNGKIVASIPNMRYIGVLRELLFQKDWKYKDSGILDRTHLRFFTKKSMCRMFEDCGYKIEQIVGINGINPYCLTSLLNKVLLNSIEDVKYQQFVIVASPLSHK